MNKYYEIVFYGEVQEGKDLNQVKRLLARAAGKQEAEIDAFYLESRVLLKKCFKYEHAEKYAEIFEKVGAQIKIESIQVDQNQTKEIPTIDLSEQLEPQNQESEVSQLQTEVDLEHQDDGNATRRPCPYCSESILSTAKKCKHCGEFLDLDIKNQQQEKQSRRIIKPLFIAIVLAIFSCGVAYVFIQKANESARIQAENNQKISYQKKISETVNEIFTATVKCVDMCSIYSKKWREGIEYDSMDLWIKVQTNEFRQNGDIANIITSKIKIDELMSSLASPPESMIDVHRKLIELYGIYSQIYNFALEPSGSLASYNRSINDLQSNLMKAANELKVMLPAVLR